MAYTKISSLIKNFFTITTTVIAIFTFVATSAFAAPPTELLPDPRDMFPPELANDVYMMVSTIGPGNSLESPSAVAKLYFDSPTGNTLNIIDGYFCDRDNYGAASRDTFTDASTEYIVWSISADGDENSIDPSRISAPIPSSSTYKSSGPCVDESITISLPELHESNQIRGQRKYVAIFQAVHRGLPSGVNSFKLNAPGGEVVYGGLETNFTSLGSAENDLVSSIISGHNSSLPSEGSVAEPLLKTFSIQDRIPKTTNANMTLHFGTPCPAIEGLRRSDYPSYITWFDDDQGAGAQGGAEIRWSIEEFSRTGMNQTRGDFFPITFTPEYPIGGPAYRAQIADLNTRYEYRMNQTQFDKDGFGAPLNLDQDDPNYNGFEVILQDGQSIPGDGNDFLAIMRLPGGVLRDEKKYRWTWQNVDKNNGIQLLMPFDSYNYLIDDCPPTHGKIKFEKVFGYGADQRDLIPGDQTDPDQRIIDLKVKNYDLNKSTDPVEQSGVSGEFDLLDISEHSPPAGLQDNELRIGITDTLDDIDLIGFSVCENNGSKVFPAGFVGEECDGNEQLQIKGYGDFLDYALELKNNIQSTGDYIRMNFHFDYPASGYTINVHKYNSTTCELLKDGDEPSSASVKRNSAAPDQANPPLTTNPEIKQGNQISFAASRGSNNVTLEDTTYTTGWIYDGVSETNNCDATNNTPEVTSTTPDVDVDIPSNAQDGDNFDVFFFFTPTEVITNEHRIYGANVLDIPQNALRDNESFEIEVASYIWPDATQRHKNGSLNSQGLAKYLWTAGNWGDDSLGSGADTSTVDSSKLAHPNNMASFNTVAEAGCPGAACLQRVPLAYVTQDDGSGVATDSATDPKGKDGSTTPNGNNWLSIKNPNNSDVSVSRNSSSVTSCGTYGKHNYNRYCGGIFSNLNSNVGGSTGNRIKNVEISNIRVEAINIESDYDNFNIQGRISDSGIQLWERNHFTGAGNLPASSQGPDSTEPRWDNIRGNQSKSSNITATAIPSAVEFSNNSGNPANFSLDPENISETQADSLAQELRTVSAISLLQDGEDDDNPPYDRGSEPLTYTSTIDSLDNAHLVWDEYVDWTQVDDKGHWYTTRGVERTGIDRGESETDTFDYDSWDTGKSGESDVLNTNGLVYGQDSSCGQFVEPHPLAGQNKYCYYDDPDDDYYEPTNCSNQQVVAGWKAVSNTKSYTPRTTETRYGWLNSDSTVSEIGNSNVFSAFGSDTSKNPTWADTGNEAYWQDSSITSADNSGSTLKPIHSKSWDYDTSDRAYSNRYIYSGSTTPSFPTGYIPDESTVCIYPADRHGNNAGSVNENSRSVTKTFYPNAKYLYEANASPEGYVYGTYGSNAAGNSSRGDNVVDYVVDTGWSWRENLQRVRYETTYSNHYRRLGERLSAVNGGQKFPNGDNLLFGLEPNQSTSDLSSILPGRANSTIYNPTFNTSRGDVFSAGELDSYFQNSTVGSAFLFTNQGAITNIIDGDSNNCGSNSTFCRYYINKDEDAAGNFLNGNVEAVFTNYQTLRDEAAAQGAISESGQTNIKDKIFLNTGSTTFTNKTFAGGAGTIIIEGDLTINGDLRYNDSGASTRENLPSVGIIVDGNLTISDSTQLVEGNFFVSGCVIIDSKIGSVADNGCNSFTGTNDTQTDDDPFTLNGLIIANRFALLRQPSGDDLRNGISSEFFNYDGRIVVNTPPGFSRIFNENAGSTEATPRN